MADENDAEPTEEQLLAIEDKDEGCPSDWKEVEDA